jgi:hypothetical protein
LTARLAVGEERLEQPRHLFRDSRPCAHQQFDRLLSGGSRGEVPPRAASRALAVKLEHTRTTRSTSTTGPRRRPLLAKDTPRRPAPAYEPPTVSRRCATPGGA